MAVIEVSMVIDDEGSIQTIRSTGEAFEELGDAVEFARKSEEDFGETTLEAENKIQQLFPSVEDLKTRIDAAEQVAIQFDQSLQDVAPFIDFGAEDFKTEILSFRDALDWVNGDLDRLKSELRSVESAQESASESTVDFGNNAIQAANKIETLYEEVDDIQGKIGAAESVAEDFGLTLDQVAPSIDFGAEDFGAEITAFQKKLQSVDGDLSQIESSVEQADDSFRELGESIDVARQSEEDFGNTTLEAEKKIQQLFEGVDDLETKINAAEQVAIQFDKSLQDVAPFIDFGAEDFKSEIIGFRDALDTVDGDLERFESSLQSVESTQDRTSRSTADFGNNAIDAAEKIEQLFSEVDDIQGKIGAAEFVAEEFGKTLDEVADLIDFGAEDFGAEISRFQDRVEAADGELDQLRETSEDAESTIKSTADTTQQLGIGMQTISGSADEVDRRLGNTADAADAYRTSIRDVETAQRALEDSISLSTKDLALFKDNAKDAATTLENTKVNTLQAAQGYEALNSELTPTSVRLERQNDVILDTIQNLERMGDEAVATAIAQDRIRQTSAGFVGNMSDANNILFETGDLVQDVQFGLRGAGNNIAFLAETIARESKQVGGFRNLLQGVFSALKGPGGVILGLQTLIALGPTIASWFSDRTEEAEELEDAYKDAADSLLDVTKDFAGFEIGGVEDATIAIDKVTEELKSVEDEIQSINQDISITQAANISRANRLTEEEKERIERQEETIENLRGQKEQYEGTLVTLREIKGNLEAQSEIEKVLEETSLERSDSEEEINRKFERRIEQITEIQNKLIDANNIDFEETFFEMISGAPLDEQSAFIDKEILGSIENAQQLMENLERAEQQTMSDATRKRARELQEEVQAILDTMKGVKDESEQITFAATIESILDVETALELNMLNTIDRIDAALDVLNDEFEKATGETREEIGKLIKALEQAKRDINKARQEEDDPQDPKDDVGELNTEFDKLAAKQNVVRAISGAFTDLGNAIADSEDLLASFGDAARQILGEVMVLIGQQLITLGAAKVVSGDVGGGLLLIGLGTALVAGGSSISPQGQQERRADQEAANEREGGGEGTFAPSREKGGPVTKNMLYETHGLGEREFFVPSQDGMIITEDTMSGLGGKPQRVNVNTQTEMTGNIQGPDLFELNIRLNEIETTVEDLSRQ